jgi:hypothetical protein
MKAVIGTALSGLNSKDNAALAKEQLGSSIGPRPNGRTRYEAGTTLMELKGAGCGKTRFVSGYRFSDTVGIQKQMPL